MIGGKDMPSIRLKPVMGLLFAAISALAPPASGGGAEDGGDTVATPSSWKEYPNTGNFVICDGATGHNRAVLRGDFSGGGGEAGLALWNSDGGCAVGREAGGGRSALVGDWNTASFALRCRDLATNRDHAVVHLSAGQYHEIQVWADEPGSASPERLHFEGWGDAVYDEPGDMWGANRLVADDGACLWRGLRRARETYRTAITALQARRLDAATVRAQFAALRDAGAEFEGAGYANAAARSSWSVVQITGSEACSETGGVVLALDRKAGTWRSIYDVPSGCAKVLYFKMTDMVVDGDRLYAAVCVQCLGWGEYGNFAIDLRTGRKARLDFDARMPEAAYEGDWIQDPVAEFFAK